MTIRIKAKFGFIRRFITWFALLLLLWYDDHDISFIVVGHIHGSSISSSSSSTTATTCLIPRHHHLHHIPNRSDNDDDDDKINDHRNDAMMSRQDNMDDDDYHDHHHDIFESNHPHHHHHENKNDDSHYKQMAMRSIMFHTLLMKTTTTPTTTTTARGTHHYHYTRIMPAAAIAATTRSTMPPPPPRAAKPFRSLSSWSMPRRYHHHHHLRASSTSSSLSLPMMSSSSSVASSMENDDHSQASHMIVTNTATISTTTPPPTSSSFMNPIPNDLYPTYRPISFRIKILLFIASIFITLYHPIIMTATSTNPTLFHRLLLSKQMIVWFYHHMISLSLVSFVWHHIQRPSMMLTLMTSSFISLKKVWIPKILSILLCYIVTKFLYQEIYLSPSRITMEQFDDKYHILPCQLSQYNNITLTNNTTLKVHYIEYPNHHHHHHHRPSDDPTNDHYQPDVIYLHHGFGASSLSWLPLVRPMMEHMNPTMGIMGHDTIGFGFGERPMYDDRRHHLYSLDTSADITCQLLRQKYPSQQHDIIPLPIVTPTNDNNDNNHGDDRITTTLDDDDDNDHHNKNMKPPKKLLLVGHSMGSLITLRTAIQLATMSKQDHEKNDDDDWHIRIILVAPALGLMETNYPSSKSPVASQPRFAKAAAASHLLQKTIILPPILYSYQYVARTILYPTLERFGRYLLRRVVGMSHFWYRGLCIAWHDPSLLLLHDNDTLLRYQYPSLFEGWEQGILNFIKSQNHHRSPKQPRKQQQGPREQPPTAVGDDDASSVIPSTSSSSSWTGRTDHELLDAVLHLPQVKRVDIIVGQNDRIITPQRIEQFLRNHQHDHDSDDNHNSNNHNHNHKGTMMINTSNPVWNNKLRIQTIPHTGHNPFEENPTLFLQTIHHLYSQQ